MAPEPGAAPLVLLTGASGSLGAATVRALQDAGARVRALIHRRHVPEADEQVRGDLAHSESLGAAVSGVAAIIHMAAVTHARRAGVYAAANSEGTRHLVLAAERARVGRFILISSRAATPAAGAYGESKLAAERIVAAAAMPYVILRPAEVLGAGASEGVDDVATRARRGAPIPIVGRGDDVIHPVLVDDVATAIAAAVASADAVGGTYVLGGDPMTMREFALLCAERAGSRARLVNLPVPLVALASRASAFLPLPLYPDQLARLRAPKPAPSVEARADLGFVPQPLASARW